MPAKKIFLLLIALMIAGGTVVIARNMLSKGNGTAAVENKATPTQEILVAAKDLPIGTMIKEADLKWQVWPKEEGATGQAIKGAATIEDYTGQVVRYGLRTGEPIMTGRTVKPGEQGFMAAALTAGMRAVSIAITPVAGVAGFVFPGDHVDIIVTHTIGRKSDTESNERRVSETMIKNVRVLALDQQMNDQVIEPKIAQVATLEVTPKQAEIMALITQIGTVSLALRSMANDPAADKAADQTTTSTMMPSERHAVPDVALDAAALAGGIPALPPASDALTWDSDVSQVLQSPVNRSGATQKVQIIRGKESTETIFDLPQQ